MLLLLESIALHTFNRLWVSETKKRERNNKKKSSQARMMVLKRLPVKRKWLDSKLRRKRKLERKRPRTRKIVKSRPKRKKEEGRSKRSTSANSKNFKCSKKWSKI